MTEMLTLTIPKPEPQPIRRGLRGFERNGKRITIRMNLDDAHFVSAQALLHGMETSEFIRWIMIYTCQQMHLMQTGELKKVVP